MHQSIAPYPILMALMEEEFELWQDGQEKPRLRASYRYNEREQEEWEIVDGIHVGFEFVAEGLTEMRRDEGPLTGCALCDQD